MVATRMSPPEIHIVDDDPAILDSMRMLLACHGLAGRYFPSAEAFLEALTNGPQPACILCDVWLPGMSGLELQSQLKSRGITVPLLLMTGHGDIGMAVKSIKAGAHDFFEKPYKSEDVISSIRGAMQFAAKTRSSMATRADLQARVAELSDRQREVMNLAVLGYSNKEIADQMGISPRTVESYRTSVMERTGASNLAELVRIAMRLEQPV